MRLISKGELKAKLQITVAGATKSAIAAVEKAGGSVSVLPKNGARFYGSQICRPTNHQKPRYKPVS